MAELIHGGDVYRQEVELDFSINVNPFGMPAGVRQALERAVDLCDRYPDIQADRLREEIGKFYCMEKSQIVCGNGASELFSVIIQALKPQKVLIPVPSFFGYEKAARTGGAAVEYHMEKSGTHLLSEDILEKLSGDVDLLFLANPNNPTGNCTDEELFSKICERCERNHITLVLDECFLDFTRKESLWETGISYEGLSFLLVKSFTKTYAIPGVRLGFLFCSSQKLCEKLMEQLPEWNLSCFAQEAGVAALKEKEYVEKTVLYLEKEREYMKGKLKEMGCKIWESETDFLFFTCEPGLYEALLKEKILIRDCSNFAGLKKGYYRIAIKQKEQNQRLLKTMGDYFERHRMG